MYGRVSIQNIKWDKIPAFCSECRHVGHSTSTCYASGKREKPTKRNYDVPLAKRKSDSGHNTAEKPLHHNGNKVVSEWHRRDKEEARPQPITPVLFPEDQDRSPHSATRIPDVIEPELWGERHGFDKPDPTTNGRGKGAHNEVGGANDRWDGSRQPRGRSGRKTSSGPSTPTRRGFQLRGRETEGLETPGGDLENFMSINKYHTLTEREAFETEQPEEEEAVGMEIVVHPNPTMVEDEPPSLGERTRNDKDRKMDATGRPSTLSGKSLSN